MGAASPGFATTTSGFGTSKQIRRSGSQKTVPTAFSTGCSIGSIKRNSRTATARPLRGPTTARRLPGSVSTTARFRSSTWSISRKPIPESPSSATRHPEIHRRGRRSTSPASAIRSTRRQPRRSNSVTRCPTFLDSDSPPTAISGTSISTAPRRPSNWFASISAAAPARCSSRNPTSIGPSRWTDSASSATVHSSG